MTQQYEFRKGDVLFRQDHVSDRVFRVSRGEVEVLREVGSASVLLGHVREGEWLGEMGVIENRNRSATARGHGRRRRSHYRNSVPRPGERRSHAGTRPDAAPQRQAEKD